MKYFTIEELCKSDTANRLGIKNEPTVTDKQHLEELINELLDPLRGAWGSPIKVTSGYRGFKLNKAVGGSKTSAHYRGYASDLQPVKGTIKEFKDFVIKWLKETNINFDQCILESSNGAEWVHLGLRNGQNKQRKQFLEYKNGKYKTMHV